MFHSPSKEVKQVEMVVAVLSSQLEVYTITTRTIFAMEISEIYCLENFFILQFP